ncbi:twin-arginine translocase TatA/TatE family subunit [Candidatus Nitrospira allomarina]|uniref:Sec-independent protein translocase protein TatA n=1 Tax=Candidatus Nitrospira allomarina TaxID=3020900 RepID=A0AA96GI06_9BACT|nr:twin-arginine translocase TatA/TatE family subunit [Candidatus Nitrospira allomarina]WNM58849.1 twin-arginine translocase TatA/TatE family subunit [Candidatus Nitrospira allomarina]
MFGTMGFSELMIILVIILIIFGAGRLPQIGEGVGKALKGFKKEVADIPSPVDPNEPLPNTLTEPGQAQSQSTTPVGTPTNQPFQPGPEQTPGTTAALLYKGAGPEVVQPSSQPVGASSPPQATTTPSPPPPMSMEDRQAQPAPMASRQYPALPAGAQAKPVLKRPAAVVNKQAVARVQAQQAAMKAQTSQQSGLAPRDMQSLGEGLGSAVRTFRDAAADIKNSIDPQMRTIQAELESAEKEMQDSIEVAKEPLTPKEPSGSA